MLPYLRIGAIYCIKKYTRCTHTYSIPYFEDSENNKQRCCNVSHFIPLFAKTLYGLPERLVNLLLLLFVQKLIRSLINKKKTKQINTMVLATVLKACIGRHVRIGRYAKYKKKKNCSRNTMIEHFLLGTPFN